MVEREVGDIDRASDLKRRRRAPLNITSVTQDGVRSVRRLVHAIRPENVRATDEMTMDRAYTGLQQSLRNNNNNGNLNGSVTRPYNPYCNKGSLKNN